VPTLKAQVARLPVKESRMLLKTIVAATSPWIRIPRPPLNLRIRELAFEAGGRVRCGTGG